ncbi:hypothetical protein [Candidatus Pristimantibacillus sp. PTI5]|uniref:hypothetical protein n=1 Tax=Candidatus Pristimantibacillus sp. PTI5 TaxID=3400422 RepID=UPI003B01169D
MPASLNDGEDKSGLSVSHALGMGTDLYWVKMRLACKAAIFIVASFRNQAGFRDILNLGTNVRLRKICIALKQVQMF